MGETVTDVISREEMDLLIEEMLGEIRKICNTYTCGYLSEDERDNRVKNVFNEGITSFLDGKSLRIRITAHDWPNVQKAVHAWEEDGESDHLQAG